MESALWCALQTAWKADFISGKTKLILSLLVYTENCPTFKTQFRDDWVYPFEYWADKPLADPTRWRSNKRVENMNLRAKTNG